jgi:hypothetical protein
VSLIVTNCRSTKMLCYRVIRVKQALIFSDCLGIGTQSSRRPVVLNRGELEMSTMNTRTFIMIFLNLRDNEHGQSHRRFDWLSRSRHCLYCGRWSYAFVNGARGSHSRRGHHLAGDRDVRTQHVSATRYSVAQLNTGKRIRKWKRRNRCPPCPH